MIDSKITDGIKQGNRNSFNKLMEITVGSMLTTAVRIVGRQEDAEDIVQDAYLKLWEKRSIIKSDGPIYGLIRRIVINGCYDRLRKEKRRVYSSAAELGKIMEGVISDEYADTIIEEKEFREVMKAVTSRLSPRQKVVFVLSEIEDMGNDEICSATGLRASVVKSNLYHARQKVHRLLKEIYKEYGTISQDYRKA